MALTCVRQFLRRLVPFFRVTSLLALQAALLVLSLLICRLPSTWFSRFHAAISRRTRQRINQTDASDPRKLHANQRANSRSLGAAYSHTTRTHTSVAHAPYLCDETDVARDAAAVSSTAASRTRASDVNALPYVRTMGAGGSHLLVRPSGEGLYC